MKKFFIALTTLVLVISLAACGNGGTTGLVCNDGFEEVNGECVAILVDDSDPVIDGATDTEITIGDTFDIASGVTANDQEDGDITADITTEGTIDASVIGIYTIIYSVTDSDNNTVSVTRTIEVRGLDGCPVHYELNNGVCEKIPAQVITIMHGAVYEIDPFHEDFSGTEQQARQDQQRLVEAQYNVIINYENFPTNAGWGPTRVSEINRSSTDGSPLADVYWVTSDWIQDLVEGNSIASIDQYLDGAGSNIPAAYHDIAEYQGNVYGFGASTPIVDDGLYYNADLVESLGVENPSQLYLDGEWNWTKFEEWATQVQTALDGQSEEGYALGGMLSYYAESMITLNGGSLMNKQTGRVAFTQAPALETYDFLTTLWNKGVFEPSGQYDSGSTLWQTGKVAMHPGQLWFMTADNRWGSLEFELGFVPYPVADDFTDEYAAPISGVAIYAIASGMEAEREELVFTVWNALQLWKTPAEEAFDFELTLLTKFDDQLYVDCYLDIYDKVYLDILRAVGVSQYGENGWTRNINSAIKDGTSRTAMEQIKPIYETALDDYLGE